MIGPLFAEIVVQDLDERHHASVHGRVGAGIQFGIGEKYFHRGFLQLGQAGSRQAGSSIDGRPAEARRWTTGRTSAAWTRSGRTPRRWNESRIGSTGLSLGT